MRTKPPMRVRTDKRASADLSASVDLRPRAPVRDRYSFAALLPSIVVYTARRLGLVSAWI